MSVGDNLAASTVLAVFTPPCDVLGHSLPDKPRRYHPLGGSSTRVGYPMQGGEHSPLMRLRHHWSGLAIRDIKQDGAVAQLKRTDLQA
jgi:hypothetical protein